MQALVHIVAAAGLGAALSAALPTASVAAETAASCQSLTFVQRRVVEHADQGVDSLRQYLFITRGTHNLYMMDVATQLDVWRAKARCAEKAADAAVARETESVAKTTF